MDLHTLSGVVLCLYLFIYSFIHAWIYFFFLSLGVTYQTSVIENCSEADWDEVGSQTSKSLFLDNEP